MTVLPAAKEQGIVLLLVVPPETLLPVCLVAMLTQLEAPASFKMEMNALIHLGSDILV